jgi:alanyl aminopeptidase
VPFCISYGDREKSWRQCALLSREREEMVLSQATGCPSWVVPNDTADGYYVTDQDAALVRPLGERIHAVPVSAKGLAVLLIDRQALLPEGAGSLAGALDLAQTLSTHSDPNVVLAAVELTRKAGTFIPASLRGAYRSFVARVFGVMADGAVLQYLGGNVGASVVRCSSCETTRLAPMLMAFAADEGDYPPMAAAAQQMADRWLTDRASVPTDVAPIALRIAGRFGDARIHARLTAAFGQAEAPQSEWLLDALASAEDPAGLTSTIERTSLSPAQLQRVFQVAARAPASRAAAFRYLTDHYEAVLARLPSGADTRLAGWFAASCQDDMNAPIEQLFAPRLSPDGKRRLERTLSEMTRCAATQQRYEASAREILRDQ